MNRDSSSRESQILRFVARRVATLLDARGESQKAFSTRIGVSYVRFNNWMRGQVAFPAASLPAIADALSVSIDDLFGRGRSDKLALARLRRIERLASEIKDAAATDFPER